jgi:glycerophosphoryl diester phosphodiesterase
MNCGDPEMIRFVWKSLSSIKKSMISVLLVEVPVLFVYTYAIFPGCHMILMKVLQSQGLSYIVDSTITSGLRNGWVLLTLLCIALFLGLCFFIEIVLLLYLIRNEKDGYKAILRKTLNTVRRLFTPFGIPLLFLSFFIGLFIHLNLLIRILRELTQSGQFRAYLLDTYKLSVPILLILAGLIWVFLRSMLVYPNLVSGDMSAKSSFSCSALLMKKNYLKSAVRLTVLNIAAFLLFALIYLVILFAAVQTIKYSLPVRLQYAVSMTIMDTVNRMLLFAYSLGLVIINFQAMMLLRIEYSPDKNAETECSHKPGQAKKTKRRRILFLFMLGLMAVLTLVSDDFLHNFRLQTGYDPEGGGPEIIAHRGNSHAAPENTIAALRSAIEERADAVEIDVQMTKDGELVLMHDRSLLRTCGVNAYVSELNYREMEHLDAGSWFSPAFQGERIPTLTQALDACRGELNVMIEVKNQRGKEQAIAEKIVTETIEAGMEQNVIVASFSPEVLEEVKKRSASIATCLILRFAYGDIANMEEADLFSIHAQFVQRSVIRFVKQSGKALVVWTVNEGSQLAAMRDLGVDAVITDRPVKAREVFYENSVPGFLSRIVRFFLNTDLIG